MTQSVSGQLASHATAQVATEISDLDDLSIGIESASSAATQDLFRQTAGDAVADLTAPNCEVLVARLGGVPIGCVALVDHLRYGEARGLFVAEEMRGRGIAVALLRALESAARDIGLRQIRIDQPAALCDTLRPFQSSGYRPADGAWMEKAL
ncbi:MAG: GNAT family N-acetyltransferase [Pseudomonadota bacterium]